MMACNLLNMIFGFVWKERIPKYMGNLMRNVMFHTRQSNDIQFLNMFEVLHVQSHPFHDLCDFGSRKHLDVTYVGSDHSKRLGGC